MPGKRNYLSVRDISTAVPPAHAARLKSASMRSDSTRLVLASASPARLATLRRAGIEPIVEVSGVDEDGVRDAAPPVVALELARHKAWSVAERHRGEAVLVVGCDSILELDGEIFGKPGTPDVARERWRRMRGRSGVLHTGHCVIDTARGKAADATASTRVDFADLTDAEIDAYIATGEPLGVAGGFTIDGLGGPFIERVHGDHHNVIGLSLPLLRRLLRDLGVSWPTLWHNR